MLNRAEVEKISVAARMSTADIYPPRRYFTVEYKLKDGSKKNDDTNYYFESLIELIKQYPGTLDNKSKKLIEDIKDTIYKERNFRNTNNPHLYASYVQNIKQAIGEDKPENPVSHKCGIL